MFGRSILETRCNAKVNSIPGGICNRRTRLRLLAQRHTFGAFNRLSFLKEPGGGAENEWFSGTGCIGHTAIGRYVRLRLHLEHSTAFPSLMGPCYLFPYCGIDGPQRTLSLLFSLPIPFSLPPYESHPLADVIHVNMVRYRRPEANTIW